MDDENTVKIYQVDANNNKMFLVASEKIAIKLCKEMNVRNRALEQMRNKGETELKCVSIYERKWTYKRVWVYNDVSYILKNCPLLIEPELVK